MSEENEDDSRHVDFTLASNWEIFIENLEKVIFEWKLPQVKRGPPLKKGELSSAAWDKTRKEKIPFSDVDFTVTRYHLKLTPVADVVSPIEEDSADDGRIQVLDDIMCFENDFPPQKVWDLRDNNLIPHPHPLAAWYGLRDFVILAPFPGIEITSETRIKLLLSSIYIAVNNTNCPVPIFVQVHKPSDHFYLGVCDGKEVRVEFEMVHLKRTPPYCRYLSGLLDVFKSKVASRLLLDPVIVSVQFTYVLRDWRSSTWTQQPPDFDFLQGETYGVTDMGKLPFGATCEPVSELHLFATWPKLVETAVVDSESYSDFEPTQAPEWSVAVKMADQPACLLSEYLSEFILLCVSKKSMHELLGDMVNYNTAGGTDLARPLDLLTETRVPTFSKVFKRTKTHSRAVNKDGVIADDTLMAILYFLFPDAADNAKKPYADSNENQAAGENRLGEEQLAGMKTVPVDSLVWRLAVVMSHVMCNLGGVKEAAHLWYEFCEEMVYRWENSIIIPGVKRDFPDHRTCLLNQKLQMLNCCIERRLNREKMASSSAPDAEESESESDEEEFFDCSTEAPTEGGDDTTRKRSRQKRSLWNRPEGRHTRHDHLRLLKTGDHLYIPLLQQPIPKTEDQVKEDVDVMVHLGTDAQAAELRARIMSASLLSDMESFKAANPDAILDDFIRWYSPRDWIEEDGVDEFGQKKGCLSPRMQIRGNVWADVWEAAKPVPARRQKRLFDDTREAEKVLHFLKAQSPSQMARLLLPVLVHAAILRLLEERRDDLPLLANTLRHATKRAQVLTQNADPDQDVRLYEDLSRELLCAEEVIAQASSLEHKFVLSEETRQSQELRSFLSSLMQAPQVEVPRGPQGPIGGKIRAMFAEAQKAAQMLPDFDIAENEEETWNPKLSSNFPQPSKRQFVMRVSAPRPAPYSTVCPQKLCAVLQKDDFRMAGCFTQDITFQ
ncbi:rab3 GTPase-activating protein catalytic subunit [Anabrus simplex]|uniref:rab3 GTPase-activating protein catalytic subunit n=1 Tax=Anabrus simplex TaxID=316456 RepID=UPI0035A2F870